MPNAVLYGGGSGRTNHFGESEEKCGTDCVPVADEARRMGAREFAVSAE